MVNVLFLTRNVFKLQKKWSRDSLDSNRIPLLLSQSVDSGLSAAFFDGGFSSLQRLLVSKCPGVGDRGLRAVLDGCPSLEELWAAGCNEVRVF